MMFLEKPDGYEEDLQVAACIIEAEWKILLLQQWIHKKNAWVWLEAGWKVDVWEDYETAMIREIFEETGLILKPTEAQKLFRRYMYYQGEHITIEMYYVKYDAIPKIRVSEEHSDYWWFSPEASLKLNLVEDLDIIIKELFSI